METTERPTGGPARFLRVYWWILLLFAAVVLGMTRFEELQSRFSRGTPLWLDAAIGVVFGLFHCLLLSYDEWPRWLPHKKRPKSFDLTKPEERIKAAVAFGAPMNRLGLEFAAAVGLGTFAAVRLPFDWRVVGGVAAVSLLLAIRIGWTYFPLDRGRAGLLERFRGRGRIGGFRWQNHFSRLLVYDRGLEVRSGFRRQWIPFELLKVELDERPSMVSVLGPRLLFSSVSEVEPRREIVVQPHDVLALLDCLGRAYPSLALPELGEKAFGALKLKPPAKDAPQGWTPKAVLILALPLVFFALVGALFYFLESREMTFYYHSQNDAIEGLTTLILVGLAVVATPIIALVAGKRRRKVLAIFWISTVLCCLFLVMGVTLVNRELGADALIATDGTIMRTHGDEESQSVLVGLREEEGHRTWKLTLHLPDGVAPRPLRIGDGVRVGLIQGYLGGWYIYSFELLGE